MGVGDVGALQEDGHKRLQLRGLESVHEFLARGVHLGANNYRQIVLLRQFDYVVEVLQLLVLDAGRVVAVGNDVQRGRAGGLRHFNELIHRLLTGRSAVEPGDRGNGARFQCEPVHICHEREGAGVRLDVAHSAAFHRLGPDQRLQLSAFRQTEFRGGFSELLLPESRQPLAFREELRSLPRVGQTDVTFGRVVPGRQWEDIAIVVEFNRAGMRVHPADQPAVALLDATAHGLQEFAGPAAEIHVRVTHAHVV